MKPDVDEILEFHDELTWLIRHPEVVTDAVEQLGAGIDRTMRAILGDGNSHHEN